MSGIYISGMEMPTSCWLCHFQDCGNCVLNNYKVVDNCIMEDRRDEECPLVPVQPHGRLIDADAVQEEWYRLNFDRKISDGTLAYWNFLLSKAPTIIPAEPFGNSEQLATIIPADKEGT